MRYTNDFTTRLLSLRLRLDGRCSSKLEIPTIIGIGDPIGAGGPPQCSPPALPGAGGGEPCSSEDRRHLFAQIGLDGVAGLEVLEALESDAAVEAGPYLGNVVLEAPEGCDLPFEDHAVVA